MSLREKLGDTYCQALESGEPAWIWFGMIRVASLMPSVAKTSFRTCRDESPKSVADS
jgi:hypothetical protein